jgi:hypothetical protein
MISITDIPLPSEGSPACVGTVMVYWNNILFCNHGIKKRNGTSLRLKRLWGHIIPPVSLAWRICFIAFSVYVFSLRPCSLMRSPYSLCIPSKNFFVFYPVRVVSKENKLLVFSRTSCLLFRIWSPYLNVETCRRWVVSFAPFPAILPLLGKTLHDVVLNYLSKGVTFYSCLPFYQYLLQQPTLLRDIKSYSKLVSVCIGKAILICLLCYFFLSPDNIARLVTQCDHSNIIGG